MPKLKKPRRTRLEKLQHSWEKASPAERAAFLGWLKNRGEDAHLQPVPLATGRYLTPLAIDRIMHRMQADDLDLAGLKSLIGLAPEDPSLAQALVNGASLRLSIIAALEQWLESEALSQDSV